MTKDQAADLREKMARLESLIALLERLNESDPHRSGVRVSMTDWGTGNSYLDDETLKNVIAEGRLIRIAKVKEDIAAVRREISDPQETPGVT